eukprot:TRINITY_DN14756_c0_g1_i1.p1 TRINITY_DN14756_c0_g1~~TRINITY_DN14756_c0_g1_i1.p1  ORF type:complete len:158 (+),score=22.32 TRINITY_DN14756_c0_g1_i1:36-509(+)
MHGTLEIRICESRHLYNDQLLGSIQPYVVIEQAGKAIETTRKGKGVNSKWGEKFTVEVQERGGVKLIVKNSRSVVEDSCLGTYAISSDTLLSSVLYDSWLQLSNKWARGEIRARFRWVSHSKQTLSLSAHRILHPYHARHTHPHAPPPPLDSPPPVP